MPLTAGRKIVFISLPIDALLDVICGRASLELPSYIPPDCRAIYSWIEPEDQLVKIAIYHEDFSIRTSESSIPTYRLNIKPVISEGSVSYISEVLPNNEDWDRLA